MALDNDQADILDKLTRHTPRSSKEAAALLALLHEHRRELNPNDIDSRRKTKAAIDKASEARAQMEGLEPGSSKYNDLVRQGVNNEYVGEYKKLYLDPRRPGYEQNIKAMVDSGSPNAGLLMQLFKLHEKTRRGL